MAQPGRFTVLSMAGKELEAQDQSEPNAPAHSLPEPPAVDLGAGLCLFLGLSSRLLL